MKGMPAVNWRPYLNRLAAIAVLAMVGLAGCDLSEAEGPGDRTTGHAVSGTAAQDVADDVEAAPSPTPTVVGTLSPTSALEPADDLEVAPSPTRTVVGTLSPTSALEPADDLEVAPSPTRTVEAINGHYFSACNLGPSPWLDGWFWDNAVAGGRFDNPVQSGTGCVRGGGGRVTGEDGGGRNHDG